MKKIINKMLQWLQEKTCHHCYIASTTIGHERCILCSKIKPIVNK